MSLIPSPSMLSPTVRSRIMNPGKNEVHHMSFGSHCWAVARSAPQSGMGGSIPRPIKLRPAAVRMASAALMEKMTGMDEMTLNVMYRAMTLVGFAPSARAASTKSSCFTATTWFRTTRK